MDTSKCEGNLNKSLQIIKTSSTGSLSLSLHAKETEIRFDRVENISHCLTGKYTTRNIHTKSGGVFSISSLVKILMTSLNSCLTL